jgi:hypothetical protein
MDSQINYGNITKIGLYPDTNDNLSLVMTHFVQNFYKFTREQRNTNLENVNKKINLYSTNKYRGSRYIRTFTNRINSPSEP